VRSYPWPGRTLAVSCLVLGSLLASPLAAASGDRYRVEVLVFRHTNTDPTPAEVTAVRDFQDAFRLDQGAMPEAPSRISPNGDTFESLWRRLERLFGYEPLALVTWEQTQADYHPPVRIHDEQTVAEILHFPAREVPLDLTSALLFDEYVTPLHRLDGTVRLRRSRFLHLDLDLEFRLDDAAWSRVYPPPMLEAAAPLPRREEADWRSGESSAGEDLRNGAGPSGGASPATLRVEIPTIESPGNTGGAGVDGGETSKAEEPPVLLPLHRLQQSRQIRSNEMNYFDTAYLGVLARVTPIDAD
jgi:hypothetical protein